MHSRGQWEPRERIATSLYNTWVSSKKEKKRERERKSDKTEKKELGGKTESVEWQACTNRLIPSLPLKLYPLLRIKNLFGHKPFMSISSKWIISIARFSCEVIYVEEVVPSLVLIS